MALRCRSLSQIMYDDMFSATLPAILQPACFCGACVPERHPCCESLLLLVFSFPPVGVFGQLRTEHLVGQTSRGSRARPSKCPAFRNSRRPLRSPSVQPWVKQL